MLEFALQIVLTAVVILFCVVTLGANLFRRDLGGFSRRYHRYDDIRAASDRSDAGPMAGTLLDDPSSAEGTRAA